MKHRKSVSLLLAGATTVAMLTGPVQAAEAPSPRSWPPPGCSPRGS